MCAARRRWIPFVRIVTILEIQKSLGFKIPERMAAPAGSLLLDPREVSNWVSRLPVANVGETSRQVFKTIVEFNRLEIPHLNRLKIAELFRRPISYISDNLRKYYFDSPFPLSAKSRKIAVLNRELYTELALAYKIFIESALADGTDKIDRKLLVVAMHRVMSLLNRVVYQSVIVYDPIPEGAWKEIHHLYSYAEQNGIHDLPVKDGNDGDSVTSITTLYKQALLFSICSPYRMRQREIDAVRRSLAAWSQLATLGKPTDESLSPFDFVARLSSDSPPLHHVLETDESAHLCRVINTEPLVKTLREAFDNLPSDNSSSEVSSSTPTVSKHLLRQLIQILSAAPKREFVRTKLNFELKVAVGVTAIHSLLNPVSEQQTISPEQRPDNELDWIDQAAGNPLSLAHYTLPESKLTLEGFDESIQETIIASSGCEPGFSLGGAPVWASRPMDQKHETFACKTINESAGGYCINWQGIHAPKIKIGEVIGVQSATILNQFAIGISRWMRNLPGVGFQLGMQMIAPNASAVLIHHLRGDDPTNHAQKCLMLPELKASGQPASLLLPTLPFKTGDLVIINETGSERKARLTHLIETTGAFSQFHFVYLNTQPLQGDDLLTDDEADFDNIWPML